MYWYNILLALHSWNRWLVLLALLWVLARALAGTAQRRPYTRTDHTAGTFLMATLHLQLVVGLVLYAISPLVRSGLANMAGAMKTPELRYYVVEHLLVMVLAVVVATVGRVRVKRADAGLAKHRQALIWYGLALVLVLSRIPFVSRPWLRWFS